MQADSETTTTRHAIEIDVAALEKLSMKGLGDLREVLGTLSSILNGFGCQPRFGVYNAPYQESGAGALLDELNEFLRLYQEAIVEVARAARPDSRGEAEARGWALLGYAAELQDDLPSFVALAGAAMTDHPRLAPQERPQ